mmetsp:Transcript_69671/g.127828  ORF Transcript_69671/g.127828 Transcript_69671/m.127828 type:complete len:92 (-) Transcript_69671:43-318(-)
MVPKQPLNAVAYCYLNATRSGCVSDVSGLETLRLRQGVVWAKPLCQVGMEVVGPEKGLPNWLCDLLVTGKTAAEALRFLHSLDAEQPVKIK